MGKENFETSKITFLIPSRNNLELLKLAYKSIRQLKNQHEILVLNDASVDGTHEWLNSLKDEDLIVYTNAGPDRVGIVGMFDKGIEMATTDIIYAFHADMVAGKNLDVNTLKYLKRGKVVSATRVEPPLHPPGPEKITEDFGIEPEDFSMDRWYSVDDVLLEQKGRTTNGIFAPWCMYKEDFLSIGGHDELFAPQSREDSDLFNRFVLNGYELIQSWDALVYHFTSRGSRFNKYAGGDTGKDSPEWQQTNQKNMRNFIRKWGTMVKHDTQLKPIVVPKYDIGFVVDNCTYEALYQLEPWCSTIYGNFPKDMLPMYIRDEQKNTTLNLDDRVKYYGLKKSNDVLVEFDAKEITQEQFNYIVQLPEILANDDELETGKFNLGIFKITINKIKTYENENIHNS